MKGSQANYVTGFNNDTLFHIDKTKWNSHKYKRNKSK